MLLIPENQRAGNRVERPRPRKIVSTRTFTRREAEKPLQRQSGFEVRPSTSTSGALRKCSRQLAQPHRRRYRALALRNLGPLCPTGIFAPPREKNSTPHLVIGWPKWNACNLCFGSHLDCAKNIKTDSSCNRDPRCRVTTMPRSRRAFGNGQDPNSNFRMADRPEYLHRDQRLQSRMLGAGECRHSSGSSARWLERSTPAIVWGNSS